MSTLAAARVHQANTRRASQQCGDVLGFVPRQVTASGGATERVDGDHGWNAVRAGEAGGGEGGGLPRSVMDGIMDESVALGSSPAKRRRGDRRARAAMLGF